MFDNDDEEDPKKPHEPFHPKKGATPYEEDSDPWRHCKEEQREATPRSASLRGATPRSASLHGATPRSASLRDYRRHV